MADDQPVRLRPMWQITLRRNSKSISVIFIMLIVLVFAFVVSPIDTYDDWSVFYRAGVQVRTGQTLYHLSDLNFTDYVYMYPPWLAVLIAPVSLLPERVGWALLCVISIILPLLIVRRWKSSLFKGILAIVSPSILYIIIHGQIDILILGVVLLPTQWWLLAAATKPQVAVGLIAGIRGQQWLKAIAVIGIIGVISLLLFGNWPLQLLYAPRPFLYKSHNIWLNLWPDQVPIGVALLLLGISRKDERFLFAAGPFLSPYTPLSGLIGPWLAFSTFLTDWQAVAVLLAWWGTIFIRGMR